MSKVMKFVEILIQRTPLRFLHVCMYKVIIR